MRKLLLVFFLLAVFIPSFAQMCFTPPVAYPGGGQFKGGSFADFNSDGKLDMVIGGSPPTVLFGDGMGGFPSSINLVVPGGPAGVDAGDLNNDGFMDIATANMSSNNISVFLGTGTGSFSAAVNYAIGNQPQTVKIADLNNDGFNDLVTTSNTSYLSVQLGNGTGTFSVITNYTVGMYQRGSIIRDFNNDSKLDIMVYENNVAILYGNGAGIFGPANWVAYVGCNSLIADDFNNDSFIDLAGTTWTSNNFYIMMGTGTGSWTPTTTYTANAPFGIESADFNGDGKRDLAMAEFSANRVSIFTGYGTANFPTVKSYTIIGNQPKALNVADFNNDGKMDIVTTVSATSVNVLLNAMPNVTVSTNNNIICLGQTTTLTASGASSYIWNTSQTGSVITVTPSASTTYIVTGTTGGCSYSATVLQMVSLCLGVDQLVLSEENGVSVFPNPTNSKFKIESTEEIKQICIYTSTGELLYKEKAAHQIDLTDLPEGIYYLEIKLASKTIHQKVIKVQ